ncbi:ABC transporter substrate-binding protein [Aquabacter sp. L1I39]|uniref:ABC transporter substrate-binding protein n=1 Tax=Aquabacter sp. L1I39 TaxID=2820278 RepID=UPI001AD9C2C7|nr:ABC transporter substrate-binding protein [Aquabacter sp. L1I39]QTL03776.1 ABC transporter substrate-binding protein [Aquabacter sp. L1I39]
MTIRSALLGLFMGALAAGSAAAQAVDTYKVKVVAGTPGYDHIQPFMAEYLKIWEKYGVNVEFIGGNYQRSNQLMSIGDYDVGYNQYASALRYLSAGIENVIVAASSANCAMMVASPKVNSWADLKGKRIGIVTKFDVQYLTLIHEILPRFGLSEKDVQLALVPVPEVASALVTGDIAAAFPFEPYGTNAVDKGAKLLLPADQLVDKSKIASDMLRNGLIMNKKFVKEHPELAKRIVWAHLDAVQIMRTDKKLGMEVLKHYVPNMDSKLLEQSYDNCGWTYNAPPKVWIETLLKWMKEDNLLQKPVAYEDAVDLSMAESYPGYPGYEKLKK